MVVNGDSIKDYMESKREVKSKSDYKEINDYKRGMGNVVYISERGSVEYKIIKNVYCIRKSKDSEYREIDI